MTSDQNQQTNSGNLERTQDGDFKTIIMKGEEGILLDHDYDGIREFDYQLPMWWLWTFFGTIIFSAIYVLYYDITHTGPTLREELAADLSQFESKIKETNDKGPKLDASSLAAAAQDPARVGKGKEIYSKNCVACHGPDGGGLVGPNLTDSYWIHGDGKLEAIAKVINEGVPEKGMLAWGKQNLLTPEEVTDVTIFVASLHGTTPASPKEPQGNKVE